MNVIDPLVITSAMLDPAAPTYTYATAYSGVTPYALGDIVTYNSNYYLRLIAGTGTNPETSIINADGVWSYISYCSTTLPVTTWGAATYTIGQQVKIIGTLGANDVYQCVVAHTEPGTTYDPRTNSVKWRFIGTVYNDWTGVNGEYLTIGTKVTGTGTYANYIYESLASIALNSNIELSDTTKWLLIGATNQWAMFDLLRNTQTTIGNNYSTTRAATKNATISFNVKPGRRIDSLALLGMDANYVRVRVHSSNTSTLDPVNGGTVPRGSFSNTLIYDSGMVNLKKRETTTHYQYYFKGFETVPSYAVFNIGVNTDNIITVTLTSTTGEVSLGAFCNGLHENIGTIQYEAENDVLNFSTFTRDFAGSVSSLVQRRNVPKTVQQIWTDKKNVNAIRVLRDALAGTPAVWCGLDDDNQSDYYEALLILGIYKKFSINIKSPEKAVISLELEEY